ncbi:MAG: protein kinase, partial [Chloroflexi bacterium]|nr:protein kinase [Chloroflexota bacterium]
MAQIGNRYDLIDTLGKGGMGVVYRAHDRFTNTQVALKQVLVNPTYLHFSSRDDSTELRVALATEFQILASLRHPHIISVLDYGFDEDGQPYFTMPLLNNAFTLNEASRNLDDSGKLTLVIQVLQATVYLHQHGIVHRDLKPSNILVEDRELVRVLDFGLAIDVEHAKGAAGTVSYMAPEVIRGGNATPASDLFGVGVILFELLTGERPFGGINPYGVAQAVLRDEPDWGALSETLDGDDEPTFLLRDSDATMLEDQTAIHRSSIALPQEPMKPVPYNLQAMKGLLEKLLAKSPDDRYQSAAEVIHELCQINQLPLPAETIEIRESYLEAAPFLGREREVEFLRSVINDANKSGQGRAILIGGESGIGKSRLLEEIRIYALVRGMSVFWGQGVAEGGVPYQLWRNPLRRLVLMVVLESAELPIIKTLVPDIETLLNLERVPRTDVTREQTVDTIKALFKRHQSPMLIILDDLQWSGESLDVLRELNLLVGDLPLVLLGAYRDDERQDLPQELPLMETLALERLAVESVEQLSVAMLGEQGRNPEIVRRLVEETEGNVFFLIETLRAVAEEVGRLANIQTIPQQILAGGIQDIIRRRLSRVPEWGRDLLQVAAVASRSIDTRILAYLLKGNPDLLRDHTLDVWLHNAHSAAVLEVRDDEWRFSHDKLRESLLATIDDPASIHEMVALAYEAVYPDDETYAAILADHWAAAGDVEKERRYAMLAGQQNLKIGSLKDALAFFERARFEDADSVYRANIELYLGRCCHEMGDYERARAHLTNSIELATPGNKMEMVAQAYSELGGISVQLSQHDEGLEFLGQALEISRSQGDHITQCTALRRQALVYYSKTETQKAMETITEALEIARQINEPYIEAQLLYTRGTIRRRQGDLDGAEADYSHALSMNLELGNRRAAAQDISGLGAIQADRGESKKALEHYLHGYNIAQTIGAKHDEGLFLRNAAAALADMRRGPESVEKSLKAMEIAQLLGDVTGEISCLLNLGSVYTYLTNELDKAAWTL